jgi:hypothetical protein
MCSNKFEIEKKLNPKCAGTINGIKNNKIKRIYKGERKYLIKL